MTRIQTKLFGLCPLCQRWMAVKLDGTLHTHGSYSLRAGLGSAGHTGVAPARVISREVFLKSYGRDYRYEREAATL